MKLVKDTQKKFSKLQQNEEWTILMKSQVFKTSSDKLFFVKTLMNLFFVFNKIGIN